MRSYRSGWVHDFRRFSVTLKIHRERQHYIQKNSAINVVIAPEHRFNGVWGDGVPVRELKIQKAAPLIP